MAKISLLPRGFKAKSERIAIHFRKKLELNSYEPLCGFKLADFLEIKVFQPSDIFPVDTNLDELIGTTQQDMGWSALTMQTSSNNTIIIHNNLHSSARQQSDIMHELAHIICEHKAPQAYKDINLPFFMREYDRQQEEEASYLGSTLQITRDGLLWALKKRMEPAEIAEAFNASSAMVTLRINSTGVKRQLRYLNA